MIILSRGLEGFLHGLMPRQLRESIKPNTATYIRVRALTVMLITVTVLGTLCVLAIASEHLLNNPALLKHDLILFGILLTLILQVWLFYRFNNYWNSGLAFTNFYLLTIITVLVLSGGYTFHGTTVLLTCPIVSFVIGGRQEGIQNAILSIVFFWVLVFLYSIGFELPNILGDSHLISSMNWAFSIAVVTITLVVYEFELQNRNARLPVRRDSTHLNISGYGTSEFNKRMDTWMHALLPAVLRQTLDNQSMDYARAQILTVLLLLATMLSFFTAFLLTGLDLAFHPEQFQYDAMIFGIAFGLALQTWLFYKFNNQRFSGVLLSYFASVMIVGVVLLSGGYDSPVMVLMLICPVGFFMICGVRSGVTNAILMVMIGVALSYLNNSGFEFTDFFHDAARPTTACIAWFVAITAIAICMMTYDTELEKPENRRSSK